VVEWQFEVYCECGARWSVRANVDDPDELATLECVACGATVFDIRPLGQHHRAGRDVE
jgi:hypothetical protein